MKKELEKKEKLVIGHAGKEHPDAITLDNNPDGHPDVLHDLHNSPYPFEDNRFKEISAHHVLEHLSDIHTVMNEFHRICRPDGEIYIEVPHHTSIFANTPNHRLHFSIFAFDGWCEGADTWMTGKKFQMIKKELTFHRAFRRYMLHKIFNKYPVAYERFWTYIFPAEHIKVWLRPIKK